MSAGVVKYKASRNSDGTIRVESITAVLICLQSRYESRCKPSSKLLASLDAVEDVRMLKATTPADFDAQEVAHPHALTSIKDRASQVSVNDLVNVKQIGCALSHIRAWRMCAEAGVPMLVAEDDIDQYRPQLLKTQKALNSVPAGANFVSLIHLGSSSIAGFFKNRVSEQPHMLYPVDRGFYGLQCYVVTPTGAAILLKSAVPVVMHIDRYVSDCISSGLQLYRAGKSAAQSNFLNSSLSHSFPTSWTIPTALVVVVLALLAAVTALGVKLRRAQKR